MKRRKKIIAAIVALPLLLIALFFGSAMLENALLRRREQTLLQQAAAYKASRWTAQNTVSLDGALYGFDHRIETFLFIGTDGGGDTDNYQSAMADFLLLMVLDHTDDTVACLQIDRNTVTDVRELTDEGREITSRRLQICTAQWYGKNPEMAAENTVYAVRQYLGGLMTIDGYFVMNMNDVGSLNHAVGGVEVTIPDGMEQDDPALRRGETVTLSDEQAAYFVRARRGVGGSTNAERMARQRQYMSSLFNSVKQRTMENPKYALEL